MTQAAGAAPIEGIAAGDQTDQRVLVASQWQLIRWRFLQHKLAVISLVYWGILLCRSFRRVVCTVDPCTSERTTLAPPHTLRFID